MMRILLIVACLLWPFAVPATEVDFQEGLSSSRVLSDLRDDERKEVVAFYAMRGFQPAWNPSDHAVNSRVMPFFDALDAMIAYHGLESLDYAVDDMRRLASASDGDGHKLDLMITVALFRLAHDLHGDAVDLSKVYPGWKHRRDSIDLPAQMNAAINNGALNDLVKALSPQSSAYVELAQALDRYRKIEANGGWPKISLGDKLVLGDNDSRVAQLRERLMAEAYLPTSDAPVSSVFDDEVSQALMAYQSHNGLTPDGQVGTKTLVALNMPIAERILQIRANMERWRHIPENLSFDRSIVVNIPDYSVTIVDNKQTIYRGIVVVGRPDRRTPFIASEVTNAVINPSWHVPARLARQDILPKLRRDPAYLEKINMVISNREDDPYGYTIDWDNVGARDFSYRLRQRPGDLNSLGPLKLNFENAFDVYMHGTSHRELFAKDERALSSGCVRLKEPELVAALLLDRNVTSGNAEWTESQIQERISAGGSQTIYLAKAMPVYFMYWSVFVGEDGKVNFRKDIYGYDSRLTDVKKPKKPRPDTVAEQNIRVEKKG